MGPIGAQEMIFIVVLALLLFGPKKLPELGRLLGKGLTEFRRAKNELKTTFESHMQELERDARVSEQAEAAKRNPPLSDEQQYSSASYPYPYDEYGRESSPYAPSEPSSSTSEPPVEQPKAEAPSTPEPVSGTVPRSKTGPAVERPMNVASEERRSA